jgi:glutamate synthase domain-containing protein 2/glutamate synthase domain-containing protein 1/glutamate synthase domain-containing protein 3
MANNWHPATATPASTCTNLTESVDERTALSRNSSSRNSLLDARFHHDSCGVGFVARISNQPSHEVLAHALTALSRLAHRGAVAADGKSSDGVGIMTQIPRAFLLRAAGLSLKSDRALAVAVCFFPADRDPAPAQKAFEEALKAQRCRLMAWREVPTRPEHLGQQAQASAPRILQALISAHPAELDRRLFLARKQFERKKTAVHICSLSDSTIVYKALCAGRLLSEFYPDLANPGYETAFAIFHQRYATNSEPAWSRAQPLRMLAHNGEINTVWGNRARMDARAATIPAEYHPLYTPDGSDSTSLDEAVELLARNGRSVSQAVRMLVPPAKLEKVSEFMHYHADCVEPWDGPAALTFGDGHLVGAALDRNGLRPCRYFITRDGLVVAGSEAGLVDLDPESLLESGRLGPGEMLVVDLKTYEVLNTHEILARFDREVEYETLVNDLALTEAAGWKSGLAAERLLELHRLFGYTREDVRMVLQPMAVDGKDAVWSMGDDTPIAALARSPRPVYNYLRQRFAQVTNPPIDALREACVVQLHTRLGPWPHLLDPHARIPGLSLSSPFLSLGQVEALRERSHPLATDLPTAVLECVFPPAETLSAAIDRLCNEATALVAGGAQLLLLTDMAAGPDKIPVPMALATGAVHHALIDAGIRTRVGLAVEAGDCRDLHHAAVLLGVGAGAVCPWLALQTAAGADPEKGETQMLKTFDQGLAKIMSKMGISVVDSYRGAHLFDSIGLNDDVIHRCFRSSPAPLGGIGFAEIEARVRRSWLETCHPEPPAAGTPAAAADLPDYGWVRFRKADTAEPHAWQPQRVKVVQSSVGSVRGAVAVAEPQTLNVLTAATETAPQVLRDMLNIRAAGPSLAEDAVEPTPELTRRFIASAMSLGSLSPEAHGTITEAMNILGARSNTGEGGEDPAVWAPDPLTGGRGLRNNKIKQLASGRFGVTAEYLANAEEIEIKIAQGSKPGEGGQLPAHKVTELIARLRLAQPGVMLISPPPHHDIYSIEDLAQLIYDLKRVNPRAAIGVKLVSEFGVGTVAAGVAKAFADYIVIAGHSGGTGASPLSSIKHAGNPWELGLAEAQQCLVAEGLRGRVRLRCDGGLQTARDVLIAAMLGADEFAFGTAVLVAIGCDMARQCHLNTCPTGIATQKPELRAKFRGKPEHIIKFFEGLAGDLRHMLAGLGLATLGDAVGRTDLLEQTRRIGALDLSRMLAAPVDGVRAWAGQRNVRPQSKPPIDDEWLEPALEAARENKPFSISSKIANSHRTLGARIAGELSLLRRPIAPIELNLEGVAGQSFGAFAVTGMRILFEGLANDFVGKGLCGGEIVLRAEGDAARESSHHVLLGNVALYGATAGRLLAAGRAGERFAVRNCGATAIVEGVGDHGCEYMTGGAVLVLGSAGQNFGAGMTGGIAWVLDEDGSFVQEQRYHPDFLTASSLADDPESAAQVYELLTLHASLAHSQRAEVLLMDWEKTQRMLVKLTPRPQA